MATATEITLALGRTVYGSDQSSGIDSDEKIEGRETRLSVTWRLTEEEQDLTLMASVLAEEAERALKQADRTVRKSPNAQTNGTIGTVSPPSDERTFAPNTGHVATEQPTSASTSAEGTYAGIGNGNGHIPEPSHQPAGSDPPAAQSVSRQNGNTASTVNGSSGCRSSSSYPAYVPPITKPQQLAIQSHCARHGVADWELRRLLWELFGKKEPRELNKDQAGELLTALQRDILSNATESSAYAN